MTPRFDPLRLAGFLAQASGATDVRVSEPELLAGGYRAQTPCAVVAFASWPQQQVLRCTLAELATEMHAADITRTAVIVVGDVLAAEGFADSYLYSAGRARGKRH